MILVDRILVISGDFSAVPYLKNEHLPFFLWIMTIFGDFFGIVLVRTTHSAMAFAGVVFSPRRVKTILQETSESFSWLSWLVERGTGTAVWSLVPPHALHAAEKCSQLRGGPVSALNKDPNIFNSCSKITAGEWG